MLVPPRNRQWAHSPDILLNHPPEQTDSFVLYIKSSIVMSRVKAFNLRFRAKNYAGDPTMVAPLDSLSAAQNSTAQYIDPRDTSGFKEIDHLVSTFVSSFPRGFKDPISNSKIDMHLLLAHLAPHVSVFICTLFIMLCSEIANCRAKILLHDPHAELKHKGCVSAAMILEAARAILNHLYTLWSTSYDLTLLDNFCCVSSLSSIGLLWR